MLAAAVRLSFLAVAVSQQAGNARASTTLDMATVYEGVLKPENIAIHVLQNLVNFVVSTFAWALLLHFYNAGSSRRGERVRRHSRIPPGWGESESILASIAAAATTFQGR